LIGGDNRTDFIDEIADETQEETNNSVGHEL
jgi:hypothetical protein